MNIYPNDPCPCGSGKKYKNVAERSSKEGIMMKHKIKNLKREKLVEILCKVADILPEEQ